MASNVAVKVPLRAANALLCHAPSAGVSGAQTLAGFTVSWTLVLWLVLPLVPAVVIVPDAAVADVEMVRVELPEAATEDGFKLTLTPEGTPLVRSDTVPLSPLSPATLLVSVFSFP